jgi:hypothetical protein
LHSHTQPRTILQDRQARIERPSSLPPIVEEVSEHFDTLSDLCLGRYLLRPEWESESTFHTWLIGQGVDWCGQALQ